VHVLKAFNYRMEGFQGAVLGVKMNHIEAWTEGRRRTAAAYNRLLQDVPGIVLPTEMPYARHVYHVFGILVKNRDAVARKLQEAGIGTNVHYPNPIHLQPCLAELGHRRGSFPNAERLADEELSLPMYPELTDEQVVAVRAPLASATAP
jgi:dTDP-4-amino-4,6-dideoxygalactose transaminase